MSSMAASIGNSIKSNLSLIVLFIGGKITNNFIFRFYCYYIIDSIVMVRREGFKTLIRKRGKKVAVAIFTYYLIRDTILYIIIPFAAARGIF